MPARKNRDSTKTQIIVREYVESLIIAVVLALIIRFSILSTYRIPTDSMLPTLRAGDLIFAYKLPYGFALPFASGKIGSRLPKRGDLVVFSHPSKPVISYVKRVVGLPGDRVAIKDGKLIINEEPAKYRLLDSVKIKGHKIFEESWRGESRSIAKLGRDEADFFGPIVVPPGKVFVLGDNRDTSEDSRDWGAVPLEKLSGRVELIWLSFDWKNKGENQMPRLRWPRVFMRPN